MSAIKLMLLSVLFWVSDNAFDAYKADYSKIISAYQSQKSLSFTVTYKSFDTSLTKADTSVTGKFQIKGEQFHTKVAGAESIRNKQYYLSIDHANKIMFLGLAKTVSGNYLPIATVDTSFRKLKLTVQAHATKDSKLKGYTINYPSNNDSYKKIDFDFDATTYLIKRVVMHINPPVNEYDLKDWKYVDDPFVEMLYQGYNFEEISEAAFSISPFVDVKNGDDAELKPEYSKYQLVNSISISKKIK
jgi:hypothetical protein